MNYAITSRVKSGFNKVVIKKPTSKNRDASFFSLSLKSHVSNRSVLVKIKSHSFPEGKDFEGDIIPNTDSNNYNAQIASDLAIVREVKEIINSREERRKRYREEQETRQAAYILQEKMKRENRIALGVAVTSAIAGFYYGVIAPYLKQVAESENEEDSWL